MRQRSSLNGDAYPVSVNDKRTMPLIEFTNIGLYCRKADVYIDPWRPVKKAVITHAHADHATQGHAGYLAVNDCLPLLEIRLGTDNHYESLAYGEKISINGVVISFHPAGHIIGSSQVRLEDKGEIWVVSGDYKTIYDGITPAFEPVKCTHFVTESTFGLPSYKWKPPHEVFNEINTWWSRNKSEGKYSVVAAYSLGKAQRLLKNIDTDISSIYVHPSVDRLNQAIRAMGYALPSARILNYDAEYKPEAGALLIVPPGLLGSNGIKKLKAYEEAIVSGWMNTRGNRRRRAVERGFVLSDHADWTGLNEAVKATGAENIYVTHGYADIFSRWLREEGYRADVVSTEYTGDSYEEMHDATE